MCEVSMTFNNGSKELLLLSGGMDSYITWHYLKKPDCAFVNVGQKYVDKEWAAVEHLRERHPDLNVVNVAGPNIGASEYSDGYIPYRNLYLIFSVLPISKNIVIGGVLGDSEDDNNPGFPGLVTDFLSNFGRNHKASLEGPLYAMTKAQAVSWYLDNVGDVSSLLSTISCYAPETGPCGRCKSCFRRWVALEVNGLTDRFRYDPWIGPVAEDQLNRVRRNEFQQDRQMETILAFRRKGIHVKRQ